MKAFPARAVVDASVAVKIFVPEELSAQAQSVFARGLQDDAELLAPDLFFIECANVFWKWVQRWKYPPEQARRHLRDLIGLGLTVLPNQILADAALHIALEYKVTAYDAAYLAAAVELNVPFITADERLLKQVDGGGFQVAWLGDVEV